MRGLFKPTWFKVFAVIVIAFTMGLFQREWGAETRYISIPRYVMTIPPLGYSPSDCSKDNSCNREHMRMLLFQLRETPVLENAVVSNDNLQIAFDRYIMARWLTEQVSCHPAEYFDIVSEDDAADLYRVTVIDYALQLNMQVEFLWGERAGLYANGFKLRHTYYDNGKYSFGYVDIGDPGAAVVSLWDLYEHNPGLSEHDGFIHLDHLRDLLLCHLNQFTAVLAANYDSMTDAQKMEVYQAVKPYAKQCNFTAKDLHLSYDQYVELMQ